MDSINSFSGFFYNLVPGAIFSLVLWFLMFPISIDGALGIFLVIVIGLFLGFFSQAITLFLRSSIFFGESIFLEVVSGDRRYHYDKAVNFLVQKHLSERGNHINDARNIKQNLHVMDNYLRAKQLNSTTELFAAKSAFWSNVCLASIIIFLILAFRTPPGFFLQPFFITISLLLAGFSYKISRRYYISQYDVVVKSFTAVVSIDK